MCKKRRFPEALPLTVGLGFSARRIVNRQKCRFNRGFICCSSSVFRLENNNANIPRFSRLTRKPSKNASRVEAPSGGYTTTCSGVVLYCFRANETLLMAASKTLKRHCHCATATKCTWRGGGLNSKKSIKKKKIIKNTTDLRTRSRVSVARPPPAATFHPR